MFRSSMPKSLFSPSIQSPCFLNLLPPEMELSSHIGIHTVIHYHAGYPALKYQIIYILQFIINPTCNPIHGQVLYFPHTVDPSFTGNNLGYPTFTHLQKCLQSLTRPQHSTCSSICWWNSCCHHWYFHNIDELNRSLAGRTREVWKYDESMWYMEGEENTGSVF